ncbi:hypothetical protein GW17_00025675 [Ensete ventricosum]|nr:hypothetical protein GW17_00025675 [Ensete ventricosum]
MQLSSKVPTGNAVVVVVVVVRGQTWVAALVPKSELDGEMGDSHVALQARLMSQALRKLSHSLSRYEERKFHGKDAFKRYLADNQAIREELIAKLREKLLDSRTDKNTVPEGDIPAGNTSEETIASDTTDDDIVAEA